MTAPQIPAQIANLITLSDQIALVLQRENEALKQRKPQDLKQGEPEKTRLMAIYQREIATIRKDAKQFATLAAGVKDKISAAGERLQAALKEQSQILARLRHVTEGIVKAIASDVAKKRQGATPYARPMHGQMTSRTGAIGATSLTLNAVV
jgi:hypothetical protein